MLGPDRRGQQTSRYQAPHAWPGDPGGLRKSSKVPRQDPCSKFMTSQQKPSPPALGDRLKISIVTAVYNRASTIGHAIESVARQDYHTVEHLIVDGGSSDGTLARIRSLPPPLHACGQRTRSRHLRRAQQGILLATGDVIGVVHSDDFLAHSGALDLACGPLPIPRSMPSMVTLITFRRTIRRYHPALASRSFHPAKLRRGWMPPHPALFVRRLSSRRMAPMTPLSDRRGLRRDPERWFGRG